jgi:hypothetical protein
MIDRRKTMTNEKCQVSYLIGLVIQTIRKEKEVLTHISCSFVNRFAKKKDVVKRNYIKSLYFDMYRSYMRNLTNFFLLRAHKPLILETNLQKNEYTRITDLSNKILCWC